MSNRRREQGELTFLGAPKHTFLVMEAGEALSLLEYMLRFA